MYGNFEALDAFGEAVLGLREEGAAGPLIVDAGGAVGREAFARAVASACNGLGGMLDGRRQAIVFVVCDETHRFAACVCALNLLGQICVPVYEGYTGHELEQLLATYQPELVVSAGPFAHECGAHGVRWVSFEDVFVGASGVVDGVGVAEALSVAGGLPGVERRRGDAALILFTSGTRATPKGVVLTNDNILSDLAGIQAYMRVGASDRCLIVRTLTHASALISELLLTMLTGGTVVIKHRPPTMGRFFAWCAQEDVSWLAVTPAFLRLIVQHGRTSGQRLHLRRVISLGALLPAALSDACLDTFPGLELINAYGLTEASPRVAALPFALARAKAGAAGYPIAGCSVRIVAADGRACAAGVVGEIQIAGRNITPGYFPRALEELRGRGAGTGAALESSRDWQGGEAGTLRGAAGAWWSTGDSGYLDEAGVLWVAGRIDSMIVHNGLNIYPEHLCEVIEGCAIVRRAAVAQVDLGAPGARLVAFVELETTRDRKSGVAEVRRHLAGCLEARRHPDEILAVSSLPTLRSGKIDRRRLVEEYARRHGPALDAASVRRA